MSESRPAGQARVEIRPAAIADVPAIDAIHHAHASPLPPGEPPGDPDRWHPYFVHLIQHADVVVAEVGGEIVGFAAVTDTGRSFHLADLFVLPDRLGGGIGGALLSRAFADRWPRTTFSSDDPRALPLYVRAGMSPLWPNLYLSGDRDRLPEPPRGHRADPATAGRLAELERSWTGLDRSADHGFWASRRGALPMVLSEDDRPTAIVQSRRRMRGDGRWIDRLVLAPDVSGPGALAVIVAGLRAATDDGPIGACVMGPSPVLRPLLEAGFRILDNDTFMASEPALLDPERGLYDTGIPSPPLVASGGAPGWGGSLTPH